MLPRTLFSAEHELYREQVRKFAEREIAPHHAQWEKDHIVPRSVWLAAGEAGLLLPAIPDEYGGCGGDRLHSAIVMEELARVGASGPGFSLHSDIVAPYILAYGTEEQKHRYLPRMAKGEVIGAIAMTEPGAGSDLQGVRTTAQARGNGYILNGQKTFITNGQNSDVVIVVAKTDPSAGAKRHHALSGGCRPFRASRKAAISKSSACTRKTPPSCSSRMWSFPATRGLARRATVSNC